MRYKLLRLYVTIQLWLCIRGLKVVTGRRTLSDAIVRQKELDSIIRGAFEEEKLSPERAKFNMVSKEYAEYMTLDYFINQGNLLIFLKHVDAKKIISLSKEQ